MKTEDLNSLLQQVQTGGNPRYHDKNAAQGKLFARERVRDFLDEGSFTEDGLLANAMADDLPADGVVTGLGRIVGRTVAVMANDSTVKAGSWGQRSVKKSSGFRRPRCASRSFSCISWIRRELASPIRLNYSPGGAERDAFFTIRSH